MEKCFRCRNTPLTDTTPDDLDDILFYECPKCRSEYAKRPGRKLCDRWLMPITLALYGLVCHDNTDDQFDFIYDQMLRQGGAFVHLLILHIDFEIKYPKQHVSDTLNFYHLDEVALREFLIKLSAALLKWQESDDEN